MTVYGCEVPRIYTPPLSDNFKTRGHDFIKFCKEKLDLELFPWQKWLALHALELDEYGAYRFKTVCVTVSRQNGKTLFASALSAWWAVEDIPFYGEIDDVIGVAQNLSVANRPIRELARMVEDELPITEYIRRIYTGNGKNRIAFNNGVDYYPFNGTSARGLSACKLIVDELREQTTDEMWDAISQVTKSKISKQNFCITSAGKADSLIFKRLHSNGEEQLNDEKVDVAIFDWTASAGSDLDDDEALLQANPSVGHIPALTLDSLKSEQSVLAEISYRCEILGETIGTGDDAIVSDSEWNKCVISELPPPADTIRVGVAVDDKRQYSCIAVAFTRDGQLFCGVQGAKIGIDWIKTELERAPDDAKIFSHAPLSGLVGNENIASNSYVTAFTDAIKTGSIKSSVPSHELDFYQLKVKNGVYLTTSPVIRALALACFGEHSEKKEEPFISAYSSKGLLTV